MRISFSFITNFQWITKIASLTIAHYLMNYEFYFYYIGTDN